MIESVIDRYREIKPSVRRLWQYFRSHEEKLENLKEDFRKKLNNMEGDVLTDDLSRVLIFYKYLADIFNQKKISKEDVEKYWRKDDVSIIEKIALPMNRVLYEYMGRDDMDLRIINSFLSLYKDPIVDIQTHIFDVSLSFSGEYRPYVEEVGKELKKNAGPNSYFYDNNYKSQLARADLDILLQDIYRNRSRLVVVFLCGRYQEKDWCGVEWRAIREILKKRELEKVMYIRMDDGQVDGVLEIDGYVDGREHDAKEVARLILERVSLLQTQS